jgi:hypothetical protein
VRITTAFNRLLRLRGASVIDVSITPQAIIVTVRLRRRRCICAGCGQTGRHLQITGGASSAGATSISAPRAA